VGTVANGGTVSLTGGEGADTYELQASGYNGVAITGTAGSADKRATLWGD
jgi:hypothetical protein